MWMIPDTVKDVQQPGEEPLLPSTQQIAANRLHAEAERGDHTDSNEAAQSTEIRKWSRSKSKQLKLLSYDFEAKNQH